MEVCCFHDMFIPKCPRGQVVHRTMEAAESGLVSPCPTWRKGIQCPDVAAGWVLQPPLARRNRVKVLVLG